MAAGDSLGRQFVHTTDAVLQPGDTIHPAAQIGHESKFAGVGSYSPNHVYLNDHRVPPEETQHFGQHTYQVEPTGPVERDPEYAKWKHNVTKYSRTGQSFDRYDRVGLQGRYAYRAPGAKVVSKLDPGREGHPEGYRGQDYE